MKIRVWQWVLLLLGCGSQFVLLNPAFVLGEEPPVVDYVVQPGDSLAAIAARANVPVAHLLRLNGLQDARQLYPGQALYWSAPADVDVWTWDVHTVQWGESLVEVARRAGLSWETLAIANHLLAPTQVPVGYALRVPELRAAHPLSVQPEARVAMAVRYQIPYWQVVALNPWESQEPWLPDARPENSMVRNLTLTPQPVARGQAVILQVETSAPGSCVATFQGAREVHYSEDALQHFALIGVPPLLEPGCYTVEIELNTELESARVSVPLYVAAGRYDYERLDIPPGQVSYDPAGMQAEANRIAALRTVRTATRYWEYPFVLPVDASITSYFGSRRSYGGTTFNSFHAGNDFRANVGVPVRAPALGVVVMAEPLVLRGNAVLIDHGWGILTGYWHLSRFEVTVGQTVTQGQIIARIGNTGSSTGPHLHWELWVNGVAVDALPWLEETYASVGEGD